MSELREGAIMFLHGIKEWSGAATNKELGMSVNREQDAARRQCVRRKLAYYEGGYWRLTDAGKEFVSTSGT